jgi:tRNA(Ile)-lysidine synthase
VEYFDADKVGSRVLLRHWRRGDRFEPIGLGAQVKLQDLFTNEKVPRPARHQLVVAAAASGELFWVEGLRIAECFKLDKRTRRRLKWQSSRENPVLRVGKGRVSFGPNILKNG